MYQYSNQTGNGVYGNPPMQPLQNYGSSGYQQTAPMQQPLQTGYQQPMQQTMNQNQGMQLPQQQYQQQQPLQQQPMQQQPMQQQPMQQQSFQQPQLQQPLQQQSTQTGMQAQLQQPLQQQPTQTGMQQQPLQQQLTQSGMLQQPLQPQMQQSSQTIQPNQLNVQNTVQSQQSVQPLLPQQTGFYRQGNQPVLEPLKPTATGFVNSFANNGLDNNLKIPAIRLSFITAQDQAKFETLFRSIVTKGSNTVSGENCRAILMKSGLQPSQLARIWQLSDTNRAGELLFPEFALAMHLINNVLQGDSIPYELDSKTKNEVSSFIDAINLSVVSTESDFKTPFDDLFKPQQSLQPQGTGFLPQTSFGLPAQPTGGFGQPQPTTFGQLQAQVTGGFGQPQPTTFGLQPQTTGGFVQAQQVTGGIAQQPSMNPLTQQGTGFAQNQQGTGGFLQQQGTGSFNNAGFVQPQNTGSFVPQQQQQPVVQSQPIAPQSTGGFGPPMPTTFGIQPQSTGGFVQPQVTGGLQPALTGNIPQTSFGAQPFNQQLQPQATGYLPPSQFSATMPLTAQKTGFGNNEIYAQSNFNGPSFSTQESDIITSEEKSLFYKIFETFSQNRGVLDSATAVEIFRKSGLNRSDLEKIWNLCDINNTGQLNKQEFALGMHLVYGRLNGRSIPDRLPPSLIPSSTKILDNVKNQLISSSSDGNRKSFTRMDALSYKNDDNDKLPNFRNRRKNYPTDNDADKERQRRQEREREEAAKKKEQERKTKMDIERARKQGSFTNSEPEFTDVSVSEIEDIKRRITEAQQKLAVRNQSIPNDLKKRFNEVVARLPTLFVEIYKVDTEIMQARIELCKRRTPSSIIGTGPGGSITEDDRRKAKSKALLRSRMNALTGKGDNSDEPDIESESFTKEIEKIQSESAQNKKIIKDIRISISELSAPIRSIMTGSLPTCSSTDFEKWEIGVGLENDVREFVLTLKKGLLYVSEPSHMNSNQTLSHPPAAALKKEATGEDRAAQLKEQAQKRMKERLAKFGISRRETRDLESSKQQESGSTPDAVPAAQTANASQTPFEEVISSPQKMEVTSTAGEDNEEEDEEERKLKEQLELLKQKKNAEKEKRLADLRRQIEEAEKEEEHPSVTQSNSGNVQSSSNQPASVPVANSQPQNLQNTHITTKPLSLNQTGSSYDMASNTYFKPTQTSQSAFDREKAEQQRKIQRGLESDDDGWSDDDDDLYSKPNTAPQTAPVLDSSNTPQPGMNASVPAPIAPPIPTPQASSPAVPVAPPIPAVTPSESSIPMTSNVDVAGADHLDQDTDISGAAASADKQNTSHVSHIPPVPVAPPLPQVSSIAPPPPLPNLSVPQPHETVDNDDGSDVLSIPDSVESDKEDLAPAGHTPAAMGIPPPPPLPNF
ncbi:EH domain profile [Nakaseomyces glabratus]|nr:EH domain profile [Nakaseomyces glabratus]KAH7597625.1 EH domain profile [Nakaseomyces glabratus]KAH7612370.1 EH domain profile [Nakaseomyces glabratus]